VDLTKEEAEQLAKFLSKARNLTGLDLRPKYFSNEVMQIVLDGLKKNPVKALRFCGTTLDTECVEAIVELVKENKTIEILSFSSKCL
jgi:hypothetical protein